LFLVLRFAGPGSHNFNLVSPGVLCEGVMPVDGSYADIWYSNGRIVGNFQIVVSLLWRSDRRLQREQEEPLLDKRLKWCHNRFSIHGTHIHQRPFGVFVGICDMQLVYLKLNSNTK